MGPCTGKVDLVLKTGPILVGQHVATPGGTQLVSYFDDQHNHAYSGVGCLSLLSVRVFSDQHPPLFIGFFSTNFAKFSQG